MSTEIIIALLSGQLLLAVWQIIKEINTAREKKKENRFAGAGEVDLLKRMTLKVYADNIEQRILRAYERIKKPDSPNLKEHLRRLQDDMELYLEAGGNGAIKSMYLHLAHQVRETLDESFYVLLVIDGLDMDTGAFHSLPQKGDRALE